MIGATVWRPGAKTAAPNAAGVAHPIEAHRYWPKYSAPFGNRTCGSLNTALPPPATRMSPDAKNACSTPRSDW